MAEKDKPGTGTVLPPAQDVIKAFGGLRPMATKLGVAVSTVQGWSTRNHIPENRHAIILKAAEDYGIELAASGASATPATPDMPKPPEKIATPSQTTPPTQPTSTAGAPPSQDTKTPQAASQNAQASANKAEEKKGDEKKDEQDKEPEKKGSVPSSKGASGTGSKSATSSGEPSKSPASSSAPTNQKSGSLIPGIILGAILVGIGFAVAIVSAHYWQPLVGGEGEDPSEAIAALEQRLDHQVVALQELDVRAHAGAAAKRQRR